MPRITVEELRKLREAARSRVYLRDGPHRARVTVHMGTCGIAAGAKKVLRSFQDELERRQDARVLLVTTGCAGLCSAEPMVTVETLGSPPVRYAEVTPEKVAEIVERHVLGGEPVEAYAVGAGWERAG